MNAVRVVAAVIERDGRYLLGRRPAEKHHGGLWEFPGGKIDDGESVADAVRRELDEELGLAVRHVGERLHHVDDPGGIFAILFHRVQASGKPSAVEHDEVGWFTVNELDRMPLAPADAAFVRWLGTPEVEARD